MISAWFYSRERFDGEKEGLFVFQQNKFGIRWWDDNESGDTEPSLDMPRSRQLTLI